MRGLYGDAWTRLKKHRLAMVSLIFLGLLGTFWGLLETMQAVGNVINSLDTKQSDSVIVFEELKQGLAAPLKGMGTAFSSSLMGLAGFASAYPAQLSGGMRQRMCIARTLVLEPRLILLDEPFGALDAQTKAQMQEWLMQLWSDFKKTVVFVTHDVDEAIYLSDEIHVMGTRPGRVVETIPINLPRPRLRTASLTPEFIAIKERCLNLLTTYAQTVDEAA